MTVILFLLLCCATPVVHSTRGPVSCMVRTVAGTGAGVDSGDGGQAIAAGINSALGTLSAPGTNNLYIASQLGNKVRYVVNSSGLIMTVAGTGVMGCSTSPGPSSALQMKYPFSLAFQPGVLLIADQGCGCVRRVNGTGWATTYAGQCTLGGTTSTGDGYAATNATLWTPTRIRVEPLSSNLFIPERGGHRVRWVNFTSGIISTLIGNGTGMSGGDGLVAVAQGVSVWQPEDVVFDAAGNVYIAESGGHRVRMIASGTWLVSTFAGGNGAVSSGDGGPATAAALNTPVALAWYSPYLFIAEAGGYFVRYVDTSTASSPYPSSYSPTIWTLVGLGGGTPGFNGDGLLGTLTRLTAPLSLAFDTLLPPNLLLSDGNRVRRLACNITTQACPPGAYFNTPAFQCTPCPVGSFCTGGLAPPTPCDCPAQCYSPGNAWEPSLPMSWGVGTLAGGTPGSGNVDGPLAAAKFALPAGLVAAGDGTLFLSDYTNNNIRVVAGGRVSTLYGNATMGSMDGVNGTLNRPWPLGIWGGGGGTATTASVANTSTLVFGDAGGFVVRTLSVATRSVATLAGNYTLPGAFGNGVGTGARFGSLTLAALVVHPPSGVAFMSEPSSNRIRAVQPGGSVTSIGNGLGRWRDGINASFWNPRGLAFNSNYTILYVADASNFRIRAIELRGNQAPNTTTLAGCGASTPLTDGIGTNAIFTSQLYGLALSPSGGKLYVFDSNRIRQVTLGNSSSSGGRALAAATVTTILGSGASGHTDGSGLSAILSTAYAMTLHGGTLYIAETGGTPSVRNMTCSLCPQGSYCVNGTSAFLCAPGTYGGVGGLSNASCSGPCTSPPGWACQGGSTTPTGTPCPPGFACPGGAALPQPCACFQNCLTPGTPLELAPIWSLSTTAGTGLAGVASGPSLSSTFTGLWAIAMNASSGAILTTEDTGGVRVRSTRGGFTSTIAGSGVSGTAQGPPLASSFTRPLGIAYDNSGRGGFLYVSDFAPAANQIRMLPPNGTFFGTFPGNFASYPLNSPMGLALSPDGATLYISNSGAHRLLIYSTLTGQPGTIPYIGTGVTGFADGLYYQAQFNAPYGIALNPTGTILYTADQGNARVRMTTLTSQPFPITTTLAGSSPPGWVDSPVGTSAKFTGLFALAVDWSGNVYVSENAGRIRLISPTGATATVIGGGAAGNADGPMASASITYPVGMAFSGSNRAALHVVSYTGGARIRSLVCNTTCPPRYYCALGQGTSPTISPCPPSAYCPLGSATPTPCPLGTWSLPLSQSLAACTPCAPGSYCPAGGDGPLPCPAGTYGATANLSSPACSGPCATAPGWGCGPGSVSMGGSLCPTGYACVGGNGSYPATCHCPGACAGGGGVAMDPSAPPAPAVSPLAYIWSLTPLPGATFTANGPRGITANASGYVVVSDDVGQRVWALWGGGKAALAGNGTALEVDASAGTAAAFNRPIGVSLDNTGVAWVVTYNGHTVRTIAPGTGAVRTIAGTPMVSGSANGVGTGASFNLPRAIAAFPGGQYALVCDSGNTKVRKVYSSGLVVNFASGIACFSLGLASSGSAYVLMVGGGLSQISPGGVVTPIISTPSGTALDGVEGTARFGANAESTISIDLAGTIYLADGGNHKIRRVSPLGVVSTLLGGATPGTVAPGTTAYGSDALVNVPRGVASNGGGVLYIGDSGGLKVGVGVCGVCPGGYYCTPPTPTLPAAAMLPCGQGFYCPPGSSTPTPCTPGGYCALSNQTTPTPCPPGTHNPSPGGTSLASACTPCPPGLYTNSSNATACSPCPPGTTSGGGAVAGGAAPTSCYPCTPGYWCGGGATPGPWGTPCGVGNYCPPGVSAPLPCPAFLSVHAALGPADGPAFVVDTAACLAHCYSGGPDQTSTCG